MNENIFPHIIFEGIGNIDIFEKRDSYIAVSGWALYIKGENIRIIPQKIIAVYNENIIEYIQINIVRNDINSLFNLNSTACTGFSAELPYDADISKISLYAIINHDGISKLYPINGCTTLVKKGYCDVCESDTIFISKYPWLRDHMRCESCHSLPRDRHVRLMLKKYITDLQDKYLYEIAPSNTYIHTYIHTHFHNIFTEEKKKLYTGYAMKILNHSHIQIILLILLYAWMYWNIFFIHNTLFVKCYEL